MPAINHLSNYNLHGSIGSKKKKKKEVYGVKACQAGGKCLHRSVFGARRGDRKEECWVLDLWSTSLCCGDTSHFDPVTPVRFAPVDFALCLWRYVCVQQGPHGKLE